MPDSEWILLYILLGSFAGFMGGLLGIGGGGILVPLLASMFLRQGFSPNHVIHLALGTSLACMIISSLSSIRAHMLRDSVVWKVVFGLAPGILLSVLIVSRVAVHIDQSFIAIFFASFMALIALQMFLNWKPKANHTPTSYGGLFGVGILIGSVSSLAAVGGGFLTVMYLHYKNMNMKEAVGTSSAVGFPIALAGTIGYIISGWSLTLSEPFTLGFIYIPAFIILSIMSYLAAPYGAEYSHRLPENRLKQIFAILSLLLSIKMLFSVFIV